MISYEPFYKTLKAKGISTYKLINTFVSTATWKIFWNIKK